MVNFLVIMSPYNIPNFKFNTFAELQQYFMYLACLFKLIVVFSNYNYAMDEFLVLKMNKIAYMKGKVG